MIPTTTEASLSVRVVGFLVGTYTQDGGGANSRDIDMDFLPADLKNVLEKELDIMKQAATTGSMDVCKPLPF